MTSWSDVDSNDHDDDHGDVEDDDKDEEDDSRDTTFSYATVHLGYRKSDITECDYTSCL